MQTVPAASLLEVLDLEPQAAPIADTSVLYTFSSHVVTTETLGEHTPAALLHNGTAATCCNRNTNDVVQRC